MLDESSICQLDQDISVTTRRQRAPAGEVFASQFVEDVRVVRQFQEHALSIQLDGLSRRTRHDGRAVDVLRGLADSIWIPPPPQPRIAARSADIG